MLWVFCYSYSSTAQAEVNQYGVDCSLTPWMSSCGDEWKTQEGMTEYSISDDGNVQVPIPFDFPYGYDGRTFTNSWMFSNGVVGFMSPTGSFCCNGIDVANGDWSNYTGLPYFSFSIAALWTDLINLNVDIDGDGIKDSGFFTQEVDTDNDGQVDTLRYLWRNISEFYNRDTANTFGAQIDVNGGIEIHHFDIDVRNHSVTVGVFGDPRDSSQIRQFKYTYSYNEQFVNDTYTLYTFDITQACQANPLLSPECPGYADAYAEVVYQQNCAANPLYDSGCVGYEAAYYSQQCTLSALYDAGCPGYEQAYYDTYIAPIQEQQANEAAGVEDETDTTTANAGGIDSDDLLVSDPVESITNVEVTGDAFVDQILRDGASTDTVEITIPEVIPEMPDTTEDVNIEVAVDVDEPVEEETLMAELEITDEEIESDTREDTETTDENSEELDTAQNEESSEEANETNSDADKEEEVEKKTSGKSDAEKQKSKREKVKEIAKKKAIELAEKMSEAATFEAQQAVQLQVLKMIGFNPDFSAYQNVQMNQIDFYADTQLPDTKIPNSKFGLRNGLAQQLLWDKMVEEQYNKK